MRRTQHTYGCARPVVAIALLGITLLGLVGCGGGGSSSGTTTPPPDTTAWAGHYSGTYTGDTFGHSGGINATASSDGKLSGNLTSNSSPAVSYSLSGTISSTGVINATYSAGGSKYSVSGKISYSSNIDRYTGTLTTVNQSAGGSTSATVSLLRT